MAQKKQLRPNCKVRRRVSIREAKNAKKTFQNLSTSDRTAMIQFLQSL